MMRFLSLLLLGLWSVCEFVVVPYVDEVVPYYVDCDECTVVCVACVSAEGV